MKKYTIFLIAIFYFQISLAQDNNNAKGFQSLKDISATINNTSESIKFHQFKLNNGMIENPLLKNYQTNYKPQQTNNNSPYTTRLLKDGLAITGAVGVTLLGYTLIENKEDLTPAELATKTKDKLPFFDRGNAGFYSPQADKDSYLLFDASYAIPLIAALIDKKQRTKFGQVAVIYLETIAITGSMYTLTAGLVYRSRPFVYGDKAPMGKRLDKGGQRSFYGGHVATTAAATFLTAKIFHDFNPGSKLTPYLYVASGGLTALMGYFRYRAGYHFLSDCVLSGVIGTATGILIPQLHKNKNLKNISVTPEMFNNRSNGISLTYRF